MKVNSDIQHFDFDERGIVTIGTFDGVHEGHRKILKTLELIKQKQGGKSIVLTFDPHPRKVLFPEQKDLQLLNTLDEKLSLFEKAGMDHVIVYPFTRSFAQIEPERFITDILVNKLKVKTLVIGYDHKFGKDRRGNIETFRKASSNYDFNVIEIEAHDVNEINVSSTKIRQALFIGDVKTAATFLGYNYFLNGEVVHGKKLGKSIGFPTANIKVNSEEKLIPQRGVYFVSVETEGFKGYGMMSLGTNPTTDKDNSVKIEVNIFNFDKDIYGKKIKVEFIDRIRDEKKFESIEELVKEIKNDEKICKAFIK